MTFLARAHYVQALNCCLSWQRTHDDRLLECAAYLSRDAARWGWPVS